MRKMLLISAATLAISSVIAAAQDAKTVIENATKAMGANDLKSIKYSGSGFVYVFGQAPNPSSPWPKFNMKSYERVIDFGSGASRQTLVRTQFENPPRGGGNQPIVGEQTQTTAFSSAAPWSTSADMWITPVGFLKGAASNPATFKSQTISGKKYGVVSFAPQGKYKVNGYLNAQNMVERVETWIDTPVLGDTKLEAVYSDYKDFNGLRFPAKVIVNEGGYPILDLNVTDARRDVNEPINVPPPPAAAKVDMQKIADGVYFIAGGSHNSAAIEFKDYVVVVEGPLDNDRSEAVIAEVKKTFPNKPIRYVINTHHHFDHAGGLRPYAADGVTIITQDINKPYYEKTFAMPRTLNPDRLSQSKKKPKIETVQEKRVITDGDRTLEIHHVQNGMHNDGMMFVYLPKEKVLIEADHFTAAGPPITTTPNPVSPYVVVLYDNLQRLNLDYDTILGLHGRRTSKAELTKAAGKG